MNSQVTCMLSRVHLVQYPVGNGKIIEYSVCAFLSFGCDYSEDVSGRIAWATARGRQNSLRPASFRWPRACFLPPSDETWSIPGGNECGILRRWWCLRIASVPPAGQCASIDFYVSVFILVVKIGKLFTTLQFRFFGLFFISWRELTNSSMSELVKVSFKDTPLKFRLNLFFYEQKRLRSNGHCNSLIVYPVQLEIIISNLLLLLFSFRSDGRPAGF